MTTAAAFPWKAEETAPSGSAPFYRGRPSREETGPPTLTKRRTEAEIKEEYDVLKGAGLPLQSMKLVLNEDLGALNEDASHVLDLNERLTLSRKSCSTGTFGYGRRAARGRCLFASCELATACCVSQNPPWVDNEPFPQLRTRSPAMIARIGLSP